MLGENPRGHERERHASPARALVFEHIDDEHVRVSHRRLQRLRFAGKRAVRLHKVVARRHPNGIVAIFRRALYFRGDIRKVGPRILGDAAFHLHLLGDGVFRGGSLRPIGLLMGLLIGLLPACRLARRAASRFYDARDGEHGYRDDKNRAYRRNGRNLRGDAFTPRGGSLRHRRTKPLIGPHILRRRCLRGDGIPRLPARDVASIRRRPFIKNRGPAEFAEPGIILNRLSAIRAEHSAPPTANHQTASATTAT